MASPGSRLALRQLIPALAGLVSLAAGPAGAMQSPWWENYDLKERFVCPDHGALVLERNQSQASLISGRFSSILFREANDNAGLTYRNGSLTVTIRGDELTLEQLPQRLICLRTEEV
ncbi:MAG: hypothetical protein WCQ20_04490 [Synechococcaceae cyanobacterium ELA739]|jgi:hypothetical protein